jgi:photosynthetic reaction center cytochrome c subunit
MDAKLIAGLPRPRPFRFLRLWKNFGRPVFILWLVGIGLTGATRAQTPSPPSSSRHNGESHTPKQSMIQEPSGAERCAVCHLAEVQGFSQSAMAHALRRAGQEPEGVVEAHGSKITISSSPSGTVQTWENGGDKTRYPVTYVIGSGNHASGYLIEIDGHLFQSPVAYYKSRNSYDLAPGYENTPDPDFTRPVAEECLLCHSGKALYVSGTLNSYRPPIFSAEAITCERCHGPAERHLADPRAGNIVNAAKLEPAARDSVCEQCHLFGASRVPNPGKKLSDFVPGQPLEETFTIYHDAAPAGSSAGDFKVISHVEQLALSACARNSQGRLWCGTCHDPHAAAAQPVAYYRSRCLSCHRAEFPAAHPAKDSDCLSCHMPRRDAKDGGHTAFTDHRIQRRPATLPNLPANSGIAAWREPPADLQKRNLGIAYIDVGMQRRSSNYVVEGYRILTGVQQQFSNDPEFFKWIGEALLLAKQTPDAKLAFGRALQLDPESALTEAGAAAPYLQEGDTAAATAHLERAVALDPLYLPAATTLLELYRKQGKTQEAAELSARISNALNASSSGNPNAGEPPAGSSPKTAGEAFKNIQVLKSISSDKLIPSMKFMASSLGVDCNYCHVEGQFEKDEKKTKVTARKMMQMVLALNENNFAGQREITCYSCHRGNPKPLAEVVFGEPNPSAASSGKKEIPAAPVDLLTTSQLIGRYVAALGGADALEQVKSRVAKGTIQSGGQTAGIEIFTKAPDKQAIVRHYSQGDTTTVYDGHAGWTIIPGRPLREMHGADLAIAQVDANPQFAVHIAELFPDLRVEYPEEIAGREVYVLVGRQEGLLSAKFYFDQQSGALVRMVRLADSPLGVNPSQVDYEDYRPVDGVQVPFRVIFTEPGAISTIQLDEVRQNVSIDPAIFAKPPVH